jgi:uncharacterized protein YndB with AHSA1/START domain
MRRVAMVLLGFIAAGLPAAAGADPPAAGIAACSHSEPGSERTLCHETIAPASVAEVWRLISTAEGWRTWAAPVAEIELRNGGRLETSYDPGARVGDAGNIRNRVVAVSPERLLVIQIADAPPGFPHEDLARQLTTAIELEPVDATRTRVRISMMGYRDEPGFETLYAFFDRGNASTLTKLRERIERGPVDWRAAAIPAVEQQ